MNPEEMLRRSTAELEVAEAELHAAQQRVEELRTIREGIRLGMERYGLVTASASGSTSQDAVSTESVPASPKMTTGARRRQVRRRSSSARTAPEASQTDLCITALKEFGGPAPTMKIRDRLNENGHEYSPEQVRSALAYLLRQNRVVRVETGVWTLPPALNGSAVPADNRAYVQAGPQS